MLDLGEGLLDWIEVWRIGRQETELGALRLDHPATAVDLWLPRLSMIMVSMMSPCLSTGYELLFDIGSEALA